MECAACGRSVGADDRFCNGCGSPLTGPREPDAGADAATELVVVTTDDDEWVDDEPLWAPPGSRPTERIASAPPSDPEPSASTNRISMISDAEPPASASATTAMPAAPATSTMPLIDPQPLTPVDIDDHRRRFAPVTFLALLGAAAVLVALFTRVVSISADVDVDTSGDLPFAFRLGDWFVVDLGDNLTVAALIAATTMAVGGAGAAFGWRWASGLAGGGGLATAGLASLVIGLAQYPIDAAAEFARIPPVEPFQPFVLTITRDVGYWALLVAGVVGLITFFASVGDAVADGPGDLNPWLAALGGVAVLVIVVGPLLPVGRGVFSDNWYLVDGPGEPPAMLIVMRLVQLGLVALGGVVGFLSVRRWGLGVAVGATLPAMWMALSTLFELTDRPIGPGFRNPGATEMDVHAVTIIGVCATAAVAVLAIVAAVDQSTRR